MSTDKKDRILNAPDKGLFPKLRFSEFADEWTVKRLGDDCEIQMCKRIFANQTSEMGDVPFYKIGTIGGSADAFITKELFSEYKAKYNFPRKGEVLITCAGTVGKTVIYDGEDAYYQDSNIVWISNPKQYYTNAFLQRVLSRIDWSKLNTTTIVRIYNDNLRDLRILYPSKREQDKISSLLGLIDERIVTQSRAIEKLQSLMKGMVVAHYQQSKKQEVKIADIGRPFPVMNLSKEQLTCDGIPCVLYGELFTTYHCVIKEAFSRTTTIDNATLSTSRDLLFPASTTVDALSLIAPSAITKDNIVLGGDMFGIHINDGFDNVYLAYLFNYVNKKNLARYCQGSTIIHLHYGDIYNVKIMVPNIVEQRKIVQVLDCLQSKIECEKELLNNHLQMKNYLLQHMFI